MIEKKEYRIAELVTITASPEAIISGSMNDEIKDRILKTIETEAPILESLLFKRVINSMSLKKAGSRILPVLDMIASSLDVRITDDDGECLEYILEREGRIITKSELSRLFKAELGYDRMGAQVEALFRKAAKSPSLKRTGNGRFTI